MLIIKDVTLNPTRVETYNIVKKMGANIEIYRKRAISMNLLEIYLLNYSGKINKL